MFDRAIAATDGIPKALGPVAVAQRDIQRARFRARWIVAALRRLK